MALPLSVAALFLVTVALPVLVLTNRSLLSRTNPDGSTGWYPLGHLVATLNAIALAALLAAALLFGSHEGGMIGAGKALLAEMTRGLVGDDSNRQALAAAGDRLAWLLPALVLTSWQIMVIVNGLLAQGALSRFSLNIRPVRRFATCGCRNGFRLRWRRRWLPLSCRDRSAISAETRRSWPRFPLSFSACRLYMRCRCAGLHGTFILICVYFGMFMTGWPALVVAAIGVLETWLSLRQRFSGGRRQDEEE